jgi:uncharacterized membrane protein YgaE (UPF0421/DUF939 family)
MSRRAYNRLIGAILAAGAAILVLLLAGVGSEVLTRPPAP